MDVIAGLVLPCLLNKVGSLIPKCPPYVQGPGIKHSSLFLSFSLCFFPADGAGGAVYAESTSLVFRRTNFLNNIALKGAAGAVSGATSDDGDFAASFCSCTFAGNRALSDIRGNSLSFYVANPGDDNMNLKFCNSTAAVGTRFPKNTVASIQVYSTQNRCVQYSTVSNYPSALAVQYSAVLYSSYSMVLYRNTVEAI